MGFLAIISRFLLVILSLLLGIVASVLLWMGVKELKSGLLELTTEYTIITVVGVTIAITSVLGFVGGIIQNTRFLKTLMILLTLQLLLLVGLGSFAINEFNSQTQKWRKMGPTEYSLLPVDEIIRIQSVFQCCGYVAGDLQTTILIPKTFGDGTPQQTTTFETYWNGQKINVDLNMLKATAKLAVDENKCQEARTITQFPGCVRVLQENFSGIFLLAGVFAAAVFFNLFLIGLTSASRKPACNAPKVVEL
jgi:hypothetical protein